MRYQFRIEKRNGRLVRIETQEGPAEFYLPALQADEQLRIKIYAELGSAWDRDNNGEAVGVILLKR